MIRKKIYGRFGLLLMTLVVFAGGNVLTVAAADLKVGVVNTSRILIESAYGKKLQARFAAEIEAQLLELDQKRQELVKQQERLDAATQSRMSEAVLREIAGELEKRMREFQWLKGDLDKKLKEMDEAFLDDMREKVQVILTQYVEDTDYAIIIENARVAAASKRVDVSDDIIRLMNQRFK